MWTYTQMRGTLSHNGVIEGTGYSGNGAGLNNPDMETDADVGSCPRGGWLIGKWQDHPHLGPCVAPLSPVGHDACGRTEIFIHGDNALGNHSASHGCIILNRDLRHAMRDSGDVELLVTQ